MIDATGLTKVFGDKVAVDNLSFSVRSGMVTGFLGPNGAGKSTTMRMILGLDHPTKGHCRVNGRSYRYTKAPMTEVGALLEAKSVHPGRTARSHLKALAATHGIPTTRVDEVIELVGLGAVARKRAGEYSLGMGQRLGLAAALLGDPETLILDEPINGLDPEGVAWVRSLLKYLAEEGRTVFISSHLMSEMAMTADHIIIIGRGRLISDSPMSELIERASGRVVKVRSPDAAQIREVVTRSGRTVTDTDDGAIQISGLTAEAVGKEAARRGWVLYELTSVQRSLEDIYMELTNSSQEFRSEGLVNHSEPMPIHEVEELDDEEGPEDEEFAVVPQPDSTPAQPLSHMAEQTESHVSRLASMDQRSRTNETGHRTPEFDSSDRPRPRSRAADSDQVSLSRPRTVEPAVRPRPSTADSLFGSRSSDPASRPRSRAVDSDSASFPRPRVDPVVRPRMDPVVRPRVDSVSQPRSSDSDSSFGSRPSDPDASFGSRPSDPVIRPRSRALDPDRPRSSVPSPDRRRSSVPDPDRPRSSGSDHGSLSRPRPSGFDSAPLPRPRSQAWDADPVPRQILDPTPRPRSRIMDSDPAPLARPRALDTDLSPRRTSDPAPMSTSDPASRRTSDLASPPRRTSDPMPRPRFMDTMNTDYRTRPRPTDSDLYRSRSSEPSQKQDSSDPLRLPRPKAGQDPLPTSDPRSDSNRPRRAWGV